VAVTSAYPRSTRKGAARLLLPGLLLALVLLFPRAGTAGTEDPGGRRFETRCCTVVYRSVRDLERLNARLKVSYLGNLLDWEALRSPDPLRRLETKLGAVLDRVRTILGMEEETGRPVIRLVRERDRAAASPHLGYPGRRPPKAWFLPAQRVIVLPLDEADAHVLAHELAHALLYERFGPLASGEIQEILARHVDRHLRRD